MKIGVFDSGVGGKSVVQAIKLAIPEAEILYKTDRKNIPYGTKKADELKLLVVPILRALADSGCEAIVVACNTVTTLIIDDLRKELPLPLIGMEPMVKPAAEMSKSKVIAVCATPSTLGSERYAWLKKTYAANVKVLEPDCADWALMIEDNRINEDKITSRIRPVCEQGADVIVLGCTHYHWIEAEIRAVANQYGAQVIQPIRPVIKQLKQVLGLTS